MYLNYLVSSFVLIMIVLTFFILIIRHDDIQSIETVFKFYIKKVGIYVKITVT